MSACIVHVHLCTGTICSHMVIILLTLQSCCLFYSKYIVSYHTVVAWQINIAIEIVARFLHFNTFIYNNSD